MNVELYNAGDAPLIKQLFTEVFTAAEGQAEGELIGNLAVELQATTAPEDLFGFVAKDGKTIVGSIFFTRLSFETPVNAFLLSPVAVATQYQQQGIGQRLIKAGIDYLRQQHVKLVFTYGDPAYYTKVGFKPITEAIAKAPLTLSHPHGWLAQSLVNESIAPIQGDSSCVSALNKQDYW